MKTKGSEDTAQYVGVRLHTRDEGSTHTSEHWPNRGELRSHEIEINVRQDDEDVYSLIDERRI